jgi:site-specific recombinase XerD
MSTILISPVVEAFAADYFVMEGLSDERRGIVRRELQRLSEHAGVPVEQVDDQMLRLYLADQLTGGLHVNTVRKHLFAIKPFYRWAWRNRVVSADHWLRIQDVSPPRGSSANGRPRPYKIQEIQRFWDELDRRWPRATQLSIKRYTRGTSPYNAVWRHASHLQTQAVISLALFGALRRDEIRYASMDDIHPDNEYIVVRGKSPFGERQGYREVPYTEEGRRLVAEWLDFRETILKPGHNHPWMILRQGGGSYYAVLDRIGDFAFMSIPTHVGAWHYHRFRHTAATEWLRAGVPLEHVSKLLGHANLTQTLVYAELVREDVARDVRRAEADFVTAVGRRNKLLTR